MTDPTPVDTAELRRLLSEERITPTTDTPPRMMFTQEVVASLLDEVEALRAERTEQRELTMRLLDVAIALQGHLYAGLCPEGPEDTRDPECPACQVLVQAQQAMEVRP